MQFRWETARESNVQLDAIKRILSGQNGIPAQPVGIGVLVFESSFFSNDVVRSGRITLPFRNEPYVGGHALCVVGYKDDASVPGGGFLIIRNSWGERWAQDCEYGAGYGMMPYAYLRLYGITGISLAPAQSHAETPEETFEGVDAATRVPHSAMDDQRVAVLDLLQNSSGGFSNPAEKCSACGRMFLSKLSLSSRCQECEAPICHICSESKKILYCTKHGKIEE